MMRRQHTVFALTLALFFGLLCCPAVAARYMENLDRGLVAVHKGGSQIYLGWRMLGTDPATIGFNLYRDSVLLNGSPITGTTNFLDTSGSTGSTYRVAAVINGIEQAQSAPVSVWSEQYLEVPLQVPAGVTTPDDVTCSYSPNDASVGDLDGDGEYEIVLKWDPSNAKDNSHSGYTGNVYLDAYEMDGTHLWRIDLGINIRAGAHYTQFVVYDLDSDGRAEVACRTAPYTVDGEGNYVLLPGDTLTDHRNSGGYILDGPEYLTIFDGQTGAELESTDFYPDRVHVSQWGDGYGNRVDRFLAGVAYLDGERPSLIMARGYYGPQSGYSARNEITAWNWRDDTLTQVWWFKAGLGINDDINSDYISQGNHNLSIGDADGDGFDEIMYGACAVDHDGTGMYSTGYGHGDAMHFSDLDPSRPGLEVWTIHEGSGPGSTFRDAGTGEILWETSGADVGRGCAGDITASYQGCEAWASTGVGLNTCTGTYLGSPSIPINFMVWWDGDLLREFLDGTTVSKYGSPSSLLSASGCSSNNGTKSTPCLSADILGDWREEVIFRTSDNQYLRIYTTTEQTSHRIYTLMHDPHYRISIAWQNAAYNQPPHTGFFLGDGMNPPPVPDIILAGAPTLYGDFNGDSKVNTIDLAYFVDDYWLGDFWIDTDCTLEPGLDLNEDCAMNLFEFSAMASNWTGPDTTAPSAPTGVSAVVGNAAVSLDWLDNVEDDLDGYNIYRSTTSGSGYTLLNTSLLTSSDYLDNDVTNGTTYHYVVTAVDTNSNESDPSDEVPATPSEVTTITIQENEAGYVGVFDGTVDSNHDGYTGSGFVNTTNEFDQYIEWTVDAPVTGTYDLQWRFANGSSSNRTGAVTINGTTQTTNIAFTGTGDNVWNVWYLTSIVPVSLIEGTNTIQLVSETSDGLANIDRIEITGLFP